MKVDPAYEGLLTKIYIHTEEDLRRVADGDFDISGGIEFYLERDIVLTRPWTPIGDSTTPFGSDFYGNGHTITIHSFSDDALNSMYLGLFGDTNGANIRNLTIVYNNLTAASSYSGAQWVGGLAGFATNTSINGVHVKGTIRYTASDNLHIGGLVGSAGDNSGLSADTTIATSSFTGTVTGNTPTSGCEAGGIAGSMDDAEITACFVEGRIKAEAVVSNVGGITGGMNSSFSSIKKSYAVGIAESVTAASYSNAGGIAGISSGIIENCYAWAEVSSNSTYEETAGGIAGTNQGTISTCHAAGTVQSKGNNPTTYIGGIAGNSNSGLVNSCMALVSEVDAGFLANLTTRDGHKIACTSFPGNLTGNFVQANMQVKNYTLTPNDTRDGTSKPLADFKSSSFYTTSGVNWDFSNTWKFLSGYDYPVLNWQNRAPANPSSF
jgi:hypothetical protein